MWIRYEPKGVCARLMDIEVEDETIRNVIIEGGCDGNLKGISRLLQGMNVSVAVDMLTGIRCGRKSTSCPDQIAKALRSFAE